MVHLRVDDLLRGKKRSFSLNVHHLEKVGMPLYHFHVETSAANNSDANGRELSDDTAAVQEGRYAAGEFLTDELSSGQGNPRVVITVERSDGTKVAVIKVHADIQVF
jgi:hypothetical protein